MPFPWPHRFHHIKYAVLVLTAFTAFAALFWSLPANAEFEGMDRKLRKSPVEERVPLDLQPEGLSFKGFVFEPVVTVSQEYTSNVLATEDNERSDYFTSLSPGLKISKNYDGHSFFIRGAANIERFATRSEENKEEYNLAAGGVIAPNSHWAFPVFIRKAMIKRPRHAVRDNDISKKPLGIQVTSAEAGVKRKFNRLTLGAQGGYEGRYFDNGQAFEEGQGAVIFSGGDRQIYSGTLNMKYDFPRGHSSQGVEHSVFGELSYEKQLYDNRAFINGGFTGDSGDRIRTGALAGFETRYKGFLFARLGAGFYKENFDQDDLDSITSLDFTADIAYSPAAKLTLRFEAERNVNQDNGFTQGVEESRFLLGADYELLHNLYLENDLTYSSFDIIDEDRTEKDYGAELRLRYLNSRNLSSNLALGYLERESDEQGQSFQDLNFRIYFTTAF